MDGPRAATLLVFSDLRGTVEPCGCSPDLRRGGLARITHHVDRVRKLVPKAPLLHAGDLLVDDEGIPESRSKQVTRRSAAVADALEHMNLTVATIGPHDLEQGLDWLEAHLPQVRATIVLTNARGERWAKLVKRTALIPAGALRVGLIGLAPSDKGEGLTDPRAAAEAAAKELRAKGADLIVALSSLGLRKSKRLMRKRLGIDVMLAGGQGLKAIVSDEVEALGDGLLIQSFVQGGQVGRLDLVLDSEVKARYALTPIGWDLPEDSAVAQLMKAYNADLKEINLVEAGTLPPLAPGQASYVGVDVCLMCHEEARAFWKADKHERAWETLEADGKTFDLECVSCHATGYGQAGGSILGEMRGLVDVQCEQCHGPGSLHAEDGDASLIRREVKASTCTKCHSKKHSTSFQYDRYRARLLVPGHGG